MNTEDHITLTHNQKQLVKTVAEIIHASFEHHTDLADSLYKVCVSGGLFTAFDDHWMDFVSEAESYPNVEALEKIVQRHFSETAHQSVVNSLIDKELEKLNENIRSFVEER